MDSLPGLFYALLSQDDDLANQAMAKIELKLQGFLEVYEEALSSKELMGVLENWEWSTNRWLGSGLPAVFLKLGGPGRHEFCNWGSVHFVSP